MKEKVYYLRVNGGQFLVPAEWSVGGRAHFLSYPETQHFYLPNRGLKFIGMFGLPATFEMEELAEGKVNPTVQLTKETLEKSLYHWDIGNFKKIPSKVTLFKLKKNKVDNIMKLYEQCKKADEEFFNEFIDYKRNHPNLPQSFGYTPKVNPFKYYDRLYLECEKVFIPLINTLAESNNVKLE